MKSLDTDIMFRGTSSWETIYTSLLFFITLVVCSLVILFSAGPSGVTAALTLSIRTGIPVAL